MKYSIVSIYDKVAGTYGNIFLTQSHEVAKREFSDVVNDEKSLVHRHPADFTLCHVGDFDSSSGITDHFASPEPICSGLECVNKKVSIDMR